MTRTKLQQTSKDVVFCALCSKPIAGEMILIGNKVNPIDRQAVHPDAQACANAPHLKLEFLSKEQRRMKADR
jgi:hypothetical protein